jgi:hypothetical protein
MFSIQLVQELVLIITYVQITFDDGELFLVELC